MRDQIFITNKTLKKFKTKFNYLDKKTIAKIILWVVFIVFIAYFTFIFIAEKTNFNNYIINENDSNIFVGYTIGWIKDSINNGYITSNGYIGPDTIPKELAEQMTLINGYIAMYKSAGYYFTNINFSLMSFVTNTFAAPATDPTTAWLTRSNAIDLAYSYMFITFLLAAVSLIMQIWILCLTIIENHKIKKYHLSIKFSTSVTNFNIFKIKMYTDFVTNLAIIFAFFNFISTLIVIVYWSLIYIISWIIKKNNKNSEINDIFPQKQSDLIYLIFVMIFQNLYTIIKAIFLSEWGVNLDLIFSIILPIGTITVIIGIFVKHMLDSKVNSVLITINGINKTISTFRTFVYTNGIDSLNDFNFVAILPPIIKIPLTNGKINKIQANKLMKKLDSTIKFFEAYYADNTKEKQYILYMLLNNVTTIEQIDELKNNALKLKKLAINNKCI